MSYKPETVDDLPRELGKISVEFSNLESRIEALENRSEAPNADLLWQWDARSVAPFGIHAKEPGRVTLVTAGGRPTVRLLTMPGDNNVNGSNQAERCDLRLGNELSDAKEGREWWFSHGVWFPDDYVDQPQSPMNAQPWYWGSCMNWHDDADDGGSQGPLQLMMMPRTAVSPDRPTGLTFEVYAGVGGMRLARLPIAPIERNMWYDFVYHIKWTATSTGFADGWVNGRQFMAHKGPTLHAGHGAYLKLANYHTAHGKPSAVLQGAIKRGTTEESVRR